MQLTVLQENLLAVLSKVIRVVDSKAHLPVLTNFLLRAEKNALEIVGSNLENSIKTQVGAQIKKEGTMAVSANTLYSYVSLLPPGKITLEQKENSLQVGAEAQKASFPVYDPQDFPTLPNLSKQALLKIKGADLKKTVQKTAFAVASDTARPVLTGLFWQISGEELTMVGTDGFRLAEAKFKLEGTGEKGLNLIVPSRGLTELERLLEAVDQEVVLFKSTDNNQLAFKLPQLTLYTRLIEADYPDYGKIIPSDTPTTVELNKEAFLPAIKQAALFSRQNTQTVELTLLPNDQQVKLGSQASELGRAESLVSAVIKGEGQRLGFNARFLVEALSHFDRDQVLMRIKETAAPVLFTSPKEPFYRQVVMPVRLNPESEDA